MDYTVSIHIEVILFWFICNDAEIWRKLLVLHNLALWKMMSAYAFKENSDLEIIFGFIKRKHVNLSILIHVYIFFFLFFKFCSGRRISLQFGDFQNGNKSVLNPIVWIFYTLNESINWYNCN